MLCTNYNGGLKIGRQSKLRPLKKEITIDKTLPSTLYQKLYTQAGGIEINTIIGKLYVYGFISTFKKPQQTKTGGQLQTSTKHKHKPREFVQTILQHQTTSPLQPRILPRTVRWWDKKWRKHAVPDEGVLHSWRGVLSYTNSRDSFIKADRIGCGTQLEQSSARRKQF